MTWVWFRFTFALTRNVTILQSKINEKKSCKRVENSKVAEKPNVFATKTCQESNLFLSNCNEWTLKPYSYIIKDITPDNIRRISEF